MVIKEHRPWRKWLFSILLLAMGGIAGWLLPAQIESAPDDSLLAVRNLRKLLSQTGQENAHLRESLAQLQWKLEVEHQTRIDLGNALSSLQSEVLELKSQLAIYKSLVKPLNGKGLHIQSFTLRKTKEKRLLSYRLVLTQGGKGDQFTQGKGELSIYGVLDGEPVQLGFADLSKGTPLAFKFKYFQILEGELLLPDNFKPTRLKLALFPKDEAYAPVEQAFDWASLAG